MNSCAERKSPADKPADGYRIFRYFCAIPPFDVSAFVLLAAGTTAAVAIVGGPPMWTSIDPYLAEDVVDSREPFQSVRYVVAVSKTQPSAGAELLSRHHKYRLLDPQLLGELHGRHWQVGTEKGNTAGLRWNVMKEIPM